MGRNNLAQTGTLFLLIVRKERLGLSLWTAAITFFTIIVPISFSKLYPTQPERDVMAETMKNPAMTAMVGQGDLADYTIGAMTAHQMLLLTAVAVAIMNILLVARNTRGEEEDGRLEMLQALPVGRFSFLSAVLLVSCVANFLLSVVCGVVLFVLGIESMDFAGSFLYGGILGAAGIFFAGVTALFAQLSESSRGTIGSSLTVLIIAYLIRAMGDIENETISWFSPLGWVTKVKAYSDNDWLPLVIMIGVTGILFLLGLYLNGIRDLSAGFFTPKPGRKNASFYLQSPIGLIWRLQRTGTIAWAVGMLLLGLSYGSVLGDLEAFFAGNDMLEQLVASKQGFSLTEQFIPMLMIVIVLFGTIPPLMAVNKLYREEKKNRIEQLLSRCVSRNKLMASYFVLSAANAFTMISMAAIGLWAAGTVVMEDGFSFVEIYGAALVYYPAILVMISLAVFLMGTVPKANIFIWMYVLYSFIVLYLGGLFQFPEWVEKLSPYGWIPRIPVEDFHVTTIALLTVMAAVIAFTGFIGYNKRDIHG